MCIRDRYLEDQIARSLSNLGLETIVLYYLHNIETQLLVVNAAVFRERLARAIGVLEAQARAGRIAAWGLATWDGLRAPPEHPDHLSLQDVLALAEETAGKGHHFRAVQLPSNLAMPQAAVYRSQETPQGRQPAMAAARALGLAAFGSASILQGRLSGDLPDHIAEVFPGLETSAQRALQFARSVPGATTALVGVSSPEHAAENFALAGVVPAEPEQVVEALS